MVTPTVVHEVDTLTAIYNHLRSVPAGRRRFQRYFSLANIATDPTVDEGTLRLYRAALSKVMNSLSWESHIVVPRAVDRQGTVFAVDTTDLGWDRRNLWDEVLKEYPYGLTHNYDSNAKLQRLSQFVTRATGTDLPCVRADWFIVTATRPPLYHKILDLPENVLDLEKALDVDVEKAFLNDALVRAGMIQSGVSRQNRLIERLPTRYGAYWKSYDFLENNDRSDMIQFPLGPDFGANPFRQRAFKQAGGEVLFHLPNGLQGYLLINARGERLDTASVQVIEDPDRTAGSVVVVNGLSCIACHSNGVKRAKDILRTQSAVDGSDLAKLQKLHPEPQVMDLYFAKDEARFQKALTASVGPFLQLGADRGKAIDKFQEPVKVVAQHYFGEVTLEQAARELGIDNPRNLQAVIPRSTRLRSLGLAPLADGTPIKRASWEGTFVVQSVFQEAARALQLGTPVLASGVPREAGLQAALAGVADKIATAMGNNAVKVGEFTGPQRLQSSGGPGIAEALADALKKKRVKVEDTARFTVDGDFSDLNDEQTGRLAVRVTVRLKGGRGDVLLEFPLAIFPKDSKDTSIEDLLGVRSSADGQPHHRP
jgi:serine/threonine-protein kinase